MKKQNRKYYFCFLIALFGMIIFFTGSHLNFAVVLQNSCKMPVLSENGNYNDSMHFSFKYPDDIKYYYLSDIFLFGKEGTGFMFSIGDVFIFTGLGLSFISLFLLMYFGIVSFIKTKFLYTYAKK